MNALPQVPVYLLYGNRVDAIQGVRDRLLEDLLDPDNGATSPGTFGLRCLIVLLLIRSSAGRSKTIATAVSCPRPIVAAFQMPRSPSGSASTETRRDKSKRCKESREMSRKKNYIYLYMTLTCCFL